MKLYREIELDYKIIIIIIIIIIKKTKLIYRLNMQQFCYLVKITSIYLYN